MLLFTSQLLQAAQQLLFIHVVPTLFPLLPELLQCCPNVLARGHPHLAQVVPADREGGHSPFLHFLQELLLPLVLQELKDPGVGVSVPRLGEKRKKKERVQCETAGTAPGVLSSVLFPLLLVRQDLGQAGTMEARLCPASQGLKLSLAALGDPWRLPESQETAAILLPHLSCGRRAWPWGLLLALSIRCCSRSAEFTWKWQNSPGNDFTLLWKNIPGCLRNRGPWEE